MVAWMAPHRAADVHDVRAKARVTFQPGWRWSECVKPVAGTDEPYVGVEMSQAPITYAKAPE